MRPEARCALSIRQAERPAKASASGGAQARGDVPAAPDARFRRNDDEKRGRNRPKMINLFSLTY